MNILPLDVRCRILDMLCEGISISSISRLLGVAKNTVVKLLVDFGHECAVWHDQNIFNVQARQIQVDEIWSFVYAKEKNRHLIKTPRELSGSIWTWVAEDADSRLVLSYLSGRRGSYPTGVFIDDLAKRVTGRPSIITDGFMPYADSISDSFEDRADHVMLLKAENRNWDWEKLGSVVPTSDHTRAVLMSGRMPAGNPSTSYVERHNLTMRRSISRLARKTNAFSKKPENHAAALSLYMFWYNFSRRHSSIKTTPAIRSGLIDRTVTWAEMAEAVDQRARRGMAVKLPAKPRKVSAPPQITTTDDRLDNIQRCWWLQQQS